MEQKESPSKDSNTPRNSHGQTRHGEIWDQTQSAILTQLEKRLPSLLVGWLTSERDGSKLVRDLIVKHSETSRPAYQMASPATSSLPTDKLDSLLKDLTERLVSAAELARNSKAKMQKALLWLLWFTLAPITLSLSAWTTMLTLQQWREWKAPAKIAALERKNQDLESLLAESRHRYHELPLQLAQDPAGTWCILVDMTPHSKPIIRVGESTQLWVAPVLNQNNTAQK